MNVTECTVIVQCSLAMLDTPALENRFDNTTISALILAQIKAESDFNENATSPVGARGLMQFMDSTWSHWGNGDPYDPYENIKAGIKYMNHLFSKFGEIPDHYERYKMSLGSYNAGRSNINKMLSLARETCGLPYSYQEWKLHGAQQGMWQYWWYSSPLLNQVTGNNAHETRDYVDKIFRFIIQFM